MFLADVVCPAEVPVTINAFKSQQHRWAKGSIQTAQKNLGNLFRADIPLLVKIQAFLHLTHYMVHPDDAPGGADVHSDALLPMVFDNLSFPIMVFTLLCLATFGPSPCIYSRREYFIVTGKPGSDTCRFSCVWAPGSQ